MGFSLFLIVTLRGRFERRWVAALAPLFTVGAYYLAAKALNLTQIEVLVAFPLYAAWWFSQDLDTSTACWKAAACHQRCFRGAAVVLFKHLYIAIVDRVLGACLPSPSGRRPATRRRESLRGGERTHRFGPRGTTRAHSAVLRRLRPAWSDLVDLLHLRTELGRPPPPRPVNLYHGVRWLVGAYLSLGLLVFARAPPSTPTKRGSARSRAGVVVGGGGHDGADPELVALSRHPFHRPDRPVGDDRSGRDPAPSTPGPLTRGARRRRALVGRRFALCRRSGRLSGRNDSRRRTSSRLTQAGRSKFQQAYSPDTYSREPFAAFARSSDAGTGPIYVVGDPVYVVPFRTGSGDSHPWMDE